MSDKRAFGLGVAAIAVLHFVTSFFVAFAAGIGSSQALKLAANILAFPLPLLPESFNPPDFVLWMLWAAISLVWGVAIAYGIRTMARRNG